jgi:hypothetical protein
VKLDLHWIYPVSHADLDADGGYMTQLKTDNEVAFENVSGWVYAPITGRVHEVNKTTSWDGQTLSEVTIRAELVPEGLIYNKLKFLTHLDPRVEKGNLIIQGTPIGKIAGASGDYDLFWYCYWNETDKTEGSWVSPILFAQEQCAGIDFVEDGKPEYSTGALAYIARAPLVKRSEVQGRVVLPISDGWIFSADRQSALRPGALGRVVVSPIGGKVIDNPVTATMTIQSSAVTMTLGSFLQRAVQDGDTVRAGDVLGLASRDFGWSMSVYGQAVNPLIYAKEQGVVRVRIEEPNVTKPAKRAGGWLLALLGAGAFLATRKKTP